METSAGAWPRWRSATTGNSRAPTPYQGLQHVEEFTVLHNVFGLQPRQKGRIFGCSSEDHRPWRLRPPRSNVPRLQIGLQSQTHRHSEATARERVYSSSRIPHSIVELARRWCKWRVHLPWFHNRTWRYDLWWTTLGSSIKASSRS